MKFQPRCQPSRFTRKYRGEVCLNCNHLLDLSDKFCPSCGQQNSVKKINFWDLLQELLSSVLSYDSKLWQTIKLMFFKPGQLSTEYVNGKRTTYTNPFRFFLSVSFLFFLVITQFIDDADFNDWNFYGDEINETVSNEQERINDEKIIRSASGFVDGFQVAFYESKNNAIQKNDSLNNKAKATIENNEAIISLDSITSVKIGYNEKVDKVDQLQKAFKENKYLKYELAMEDGFIDDSFSDWFIYRFFRGLAKTEKNVAGFLRYVLPKIPFFIFLFIPLFSIINFILFLNRKNSYVDHLVFNFNLSSFLLLIFAIMIGIDNQFESVSVSFGLNLISNLGILFYTYNSIRNFYGNGRFLSLFKSLLIGFLYPLSAVVFLLSLMTLSFLFY